MTKKVFLSVLVLALVLGLLFGAYLFMQKQTEKQIAQKFYLAENLAREGKWSEAGSLFKEIFDKFPGSTKAVDSLFYYGLSLEKQGDKKESEAVFSRIIKEFPKSSLVAPSLIEIAGFHKDEGNLQEAEKIYEKITRDFSASDSLGAAWLGLGEINEKSDKLAEAKSFYERVLKEFPEGELQSSAQKLLGNLTVKMILSSYPIAGSFVYKVSAGDTLDSIARRFNTTVDLIREANQIEGSSLSIGRRLKVTPSQFNIIVSKSRNTLVLKYNDEIIKVYTVATGKSGCTPVGDFKIVSKLKDPDWYRYGRRIPSGDPENILGSRWMGISEESYGIHGTTLPETIGSQSTDGCVRMLNEDVEELYKLVTIGTTVKIVE